MRDAAVTLIIFGALIFAIKRPWVGALVYVMVSSMNFQHFGYYYALTIPFAMIVALTTIFSMFITKDEIGLPINGTTVLLIIFPLWMCVTYLLALEHEPDGYRRWNEVMKIFFFTLITAAILKTRKHVEWMLWAIVIAVGFYGVKGGLFTIASGGSYRVWGPPGNNAITENNAFAVALIMMVPLMYYLRGVVDKIWMKWGLLGAIGLCIMSILGSHSRGALIGVSAMVLFLWLKSRNKFMLGLLMVALLPVAISFMPDNWTDRMKTIRTYQEDGSAMGRLNSWKMAINIANDRPLIGGGFELYTAKTFARYAPDPLDIHSAHSIYFQMLGEHGYPGLIMFLSLGIIGWLNASRIIARSRGDPELKWAGDLARMIQVSLVGYAVGGAFVNIGYWEILYYLLVILMVVLNLTQPEKSKPIRSFVRSRNEGIVKQS